MSQLAPLVKAEPRRLQPECSCLFRGECLLFGAHKLNQQSQQTLPSCVSFGTSRGRMRRSSEVLHPSQLWEGKAHFRTCPTVCSFVHISSHVEFILENKLCQNFISLITVSRSKVLLIQKLEREPSEDFTRAHQLESWCLLRYHGHMIVINIYGPQTLS